MLTPLASWWIKPRARTYQLAYDLTGNRHDAEDIMQDAYIRAFRGLGGENSGER